MPVSLLQEYNKKETERRWKEPKRSRPVLPGLLDIKVLAQVTSTLLAKLYCDSSLLPIQCFIISFRQKEIDLTLIRLRPFFWPQVHLKKMLPQNKIF